MADRSPSPYLITKSGDAEYNRGLNVLYRYTACIWMLASAALGAFAYGSTLTADAGPWRAVVPSLAAVVFLAMLLRLITPGRPEWSRWSLLLMGGLSVCTGILSFWGAEGLGFTAVRMAVIGLTLFPAAIAYMHWIGERMVSRR